MNQYIQSGGGSKEVDIATIKQSIQQTKESFEACKYIKKGMKNHLQNNSVINIVKGISNRANWRKICAKVKKTPRYMVKKVYETCHIAYNSPTHIKNLFRSTIQCVKACGKSVKECTEHCYRSYIPSAESCKRSLRNLTQVSKDQPMIYKSYIFSPVRNLIDLFSLLRSNSKKQAKCPKKPLTGAQRRQAQKKVKAQQNEAQEKAAPINLGLVSATAHSTSSDIGAPSRYFSALSDFFSSASASASTHVPVDVNTVSATVDPTVHSVDPTVHRRSSRFRRSLSSASVPLALAPSPASAPAPSPASALPTSLSSTRAASALPTSLPPAEANAPAEAEVTPLEANAPAEVILGPRRSSSSEHI
jgi:hypothetical protein